MRLSVALTDCTCLLGEFGQKRPTNVSEPLMHVMRIQLAFPNLVLAICEPAQAARNASVTESLAARIAGVRPLKSARARAQQMP